MIDKGSLFLAQVNTMNDLKNAVPLADILSLNDLKNAIGHAVPVALILGYFYAVVLIIMACVQERGDGSWKLSLARGIGIFAAVGVVNILLAVFFPGQTITLNWG